MAAALVVCQHKAIDEANEQLLLDTILRSQEEDRRRKDEKLRQEQELTVKGFILPSEVFNKVQTATSLVVCRVDRFTFCVRLSIALLVVLYVCSRCC